MSAKTDTIAATMRRVRDDIDGIRDRIFEIRQALDEVAALPPDVASIEQAVDDYVASRAKLGGLEFPYIGAAVGINPNSLDLFIRGEAAHRPELVLAVLVPDALRAALLRNMPRHGITAADRTARLAKLDRDLLIAEIAEELAIREVEDATGARLFRRVDADPAILLAPTAELQAGGRA